MSAAFDRTARAVVISVLGQAPHWGTLCGLHEHDDDLPDAGPEVVAEQWNEFHRAAAPLLALADDRDLTTRQRRDLDIVRHSLDFLLFSLTGVERWKKDPDALEEIGPALSVQLTRDYAPLDQRMDMLAGRLDRLPEYLRNYRKQALDPVPLWTDMAIATTAEMPGYFQAIAATAEQAVTAAVQERLNRAVDQAARATDEYYTWLVRDVRPRATGEWSIGPEAFAELCERRELGRTPDEIRALGEDLLQRGRAEFEHLADQVRPGATPMEALEIAAADYARTFPDVLAEYVRATGAAQEFVRARALLTLSEDDWLDVVETPLFLRRLLPVAGYVNPGRFDDVQSGTLLVTPPEQADDLRALHNAASIWNTAVHETYPGHHVQAVAANANPGFVRVFPTLFGTAAETTEGWALYSEHIMADEGFQESSQRRLVQMRDHCLRAARVLIDVGLQTRTMTLEEAETMLCQEIGLTPETARAEVRSYTRAPGYFMSYLLGAYDLMHLRGEVEARLGEHFDLCWFHDTVLAAGEIPLKYLRREVDEAAGALLREVAAPVAEEDEPNV